MGPGIGVTDDTKRLIEWLISDASKPERPMLIDADGLNALAAIGCETLKRARGATVLTPHPGEASRLLSVNTENNQRRSRVGRAYFGGAHRRVRAD